jgi:hypothetical protein
MRTLSIIIVLLFASSAHITAQTQVVHTPRTSPRAEISQTVGITEISIDYSRPRVRGREIWGKLVPFGMHNPGWGTAKSAPWRTGADENTIISFSTPVKLNGADVAAGTYGLFMVVAENGLIEILLCSNNESWGAYFFDEKEVVARAQTSWQEHPFTEYLEFEFNDFTENSVYCALNWGEKSIPFEIEVGISETVVNQLRNDLRGTARFSYVGPLEAADWCVSNNTNLEEALEWAKLAVTMDKQFQTLKTKAAAEYALGMNKEADLTMKEAMPLAGIFELHSYGRQVITEGKVTQAMDVFTANLELHPNKWPVNYGMARGLSAKGDYAKAAEYLKKAEVNCPDDNNREIIKKNIEKLGRNEDIN